MTNLDQTGRERLEPRPVSRPPVDPAAQRAFGRPDGVNGSFVGLDKYRDQGEYTPTNQPPGRSTRWQATSTSSTSGTCSST